MLIQYDNLIGQCRSLNNVNRVHIAFGNTITPSEVVALYESLFVDKVHSFPALRDDRRFTDNELKDSARDWIDGLLSDLKRVGKARSESFVRRDIRKNVTLLTNGGEASCKTLLVTLPGANHRLMMPLPTFLQNLDAKLVDVLIVRDGTRSAYKHGVEGLGANVVELADGVRSLVDFQSYERVVGLGVSAGGLPMIMMSLKLDIDVLACGPSGPLDPKWAGVEGPPDLVWHHSLGDGHGSRIVVAFGAQSARDRQSAADIAAVLPVEKVEVAIQGLKIEHNILHPMSERRLLPEFFQKHLGLPQS